MDDQNDALIARARRTHLLGLNSDDLAARGDDQEVVLNRPNYRHWRPTSSINMLGVDDFFSDWCEWASLSK